MPAVCGCIPVLDCSCGFRPKRSAHDAIRALDHVVHRGKVNWILEADIVSFFDSMDRTKLKEMLQLRVADGSLIRLIGKCLHVGVLDGAEYSTPETGTAQGSVLSPRCRSSASRFEVAQASIEILVPWRQGFVCGSEFRDPATVTRSLFEGGQQADVGHAMGQSLEEQVGREIPGIRFVRDPPEAKCIGYAHRG